MNSTITIRIPKGLRQELQSVAKAEHVPMSDLIREALRKTIAIHQFRRIRRRVLPYARAQGFLTDEDIFNAVS